MSMLVKRHKTILIQSFFIVSGIWGYFRYDRTYIESSLLLCQGAKVQIRETDFEPDWGLYNGSMRKVIDMEYKPGESPKDGFQPAYTAVDFPQYCGPA